MRTLERMTTLNRMRNTGLDWGLTGEYSTERLNACCDLLERDGMEPGLFKPYPAMQCALLDDFAFLCTASCGGTALRAPGLTHG